MDEGGDGDEDDDSDGVGVGDRVPPPWGTTPPDSPHQLQRETSLQYEGGIVPELDIYAIPSCDCEYLLGMFCLKVYDVFRWLVIKIGCIAQCPKI